MMGVEKAIKHLASPMALQRYRHILTRTLQSVRLASGSRITLPSAFRGHSLWGLRTVGVKENTSSTKVASTEFENLDLGGVLGRRISVPPKGAVIAEGEPAVAVYTLTRGTAALSKMEGHGRKRIVGFALPGDFLNSPFEDRHSCSVDAVGEITVCQFSTQAFLDHLQAHPASMYRMLEMTFERINAAHEHMLLVGRATAEERLVEFIIDWRARLNRRGALANMVLLPMSRRDIADYLGLTIETASRMLWKLGRERILRVIPEGLQLMGPAERPSLLERGMTRRGDPTAANEPTSIFLAAKPSYRTGTSVVQRGPEIIDARPNRRE